MALGIPEAIASVAELLTKVFGFVVDPDGLAKMKLDNQVDLVHAGVKIAIRNKDSDTADLLFERYRELWVQLP